MRVADLRIYPVKALGGTICPAVEIDPWGLRGDRGWMVTNPAGRFLTQRDDGQMALIQAVGTATGLTLTDRAGRHIDVAFPAPDTAPEHVTIWRDRVPALPAAEAAHAWLSRALGVPCRLVHLADKTARPIDPVFAAAGETVSFADGFPVLLASLSSLADLNARLAAPIPIGRFRPNIVIEGAPAWVEDTWRRIRIGTALFRVVKPCDRCVVTTIDPATGTRPEKEEPLRTLRTFRRDAAGRVMFGQNLIPQSPGRIHAGDPVEILERGPSNVTPWTG